MRIAFVHSFYSSKQPSGENLVVQAEVNALRKAGHDVEVFAARTDELEADRFYPLRAAWRVATGHGQNPLEAIRLSAPDIVHIHNLFPNFGRRWVEELDIPVVHTLHNYRPMCANGLLFRDGHTCTDCPDGKRWSGVLHACYRDSRLATLPIAWANRRGTMSDPLIHRADALIALSERQKSLYSSAGVPSEKMVVWPNFLPDELDPGSLETSKREGWLYIGRLSQEKGILRLIEHWPTEHQLNIVGDGEHQQEVMKESSGKTISFLGSTSRAEVLSLMSRNVGLLFPSLWYEAFPLVYLEALASGLPILAFEPNVMAEFVRRDGTGWVARWEDDLTALLDRGIAEVEGLRAHCRTVFERIGTEAAYIDRSRLLYDGLIRETTKGSVRRP